VGFFPRVLGFQRFFASSLHLLPSGTTDSGTNCEIRSASWAILAISFLAPDRRPARHPFGPLHHPRRPENTVSGGMLQDSDLDDFNVFPGESPALPVMSPAVRAPLMWWIRPRFPPTFGFFSNVSSLQNPVRT